MSLLHSRRFEMGAASFRSEEERLKAKAGHEAIKSNLEGLADEQRTRATDAIFRDDPTEHRRQAEKLAYTNKLIAEQADRIRRIDEGWDDFAGYR
jgi:hypothetical protein